MSYDKEQLQNDTLRNLKESSLSEEEKTKIAKDFFAAVAEEKENKSIDKLNIFYDYLKSFFLPIYGFVIGIKKITEEDYINGVICIILNIIEIILIISSLSGLFSTKGSISQISKGIGGGYKSINTPIGN